ncbi:MAG: hypothetical protein HQL27_04570 [Candidatus Omnitrophica bacterium]|nr:hypothetical protein [Candidatus Omnitrophota bacterium]
MFKTRFCFTKKIYIFVCLAGSFLFPFSSISSSQEVFGLNKICTDGELGLQFACSDSWKLDVVKDAVLIVISSNPEATLIIAKINSTIKYPEQLTKERLKEVKQYEEGFDIEKVKIRDKEFIKVKAFSAEEPQRRILDYYLIRGNELYGILFTVEPKEAMDKYKFMFQRIVESITFI